MLASCGPLSIACISSRASPCPAQACVPCPKPMWTEALWRLKLKAQLEEAKGALGEAFDEMKKIELLDERDQMREREAESAAEQAELDGIALLRARGIAPA